MALVNDAGITPRDLTGYIELFRELYREAFGEDLALDDETVAGQLIGIQSLPLALNDEALVSMANAMSPRRATKRHLDDLADMLFLDRRGATKSTVTLSFTGVPATEIPAGIRCRTDDGTVFVTLEAITLTAVSVEAKAEAVEAGPVEAAASSITHIVTLTEGLETVTNAAAAVPGKAEETDEEFRARYAVEVMVRAVSPIDGLRAALVEAGATVSPVVVENDTAAAITKQGFTIAPHSILIIADGGDADDLDAAIRLHKPGGCGLVVAIKGNDHDLASLTSNTAFTWAGQNFVVAFDANDDTAAEYAAALETTIKAGTGSVAPLTEVAYQEAPGDRFLLIYPIFPDTDYVIPRGNLAVALGLDSGNTALPPGLFIRPEKRTLTVTANVTALDDFPADGLTRLKAAVKAEAARLAIGEKPWKQNFLQALESVPGTQVTAYTVTDGATDIASVTMPLDRLYQLASDSPEITLTT